MKNTLNKLKKYANIKIIGENVQVEMKPNVKISMKYIQKLVNELKENKSQAMFLLNDLVSEDYLLKAKQYAMKKGYLLSNNIYSKQITRNSIVIIDFLNEEWEGYRLTYDKENKVKSEKDIIRDADLFNAINRTELYVYNYINFIDKAS